MRPYLDTDEGAVVAMAEASRDIDPGTPHIDSSRWRFVCNDPHVDPESHFRVAETASDEIAGLAYRFDPPRHDAGTFRAVFVIVHPDYRRRGIGRALYEAVACEQDRERMDDGWHLATAIEDSSRAGLPFARAMGFKRSSERFVMRRDLPGPQLPELECEAVIEPFLGASAYRDWAHIHNATLEGLEGTSAVTEDELEDNRPDDFRPEHVRFARIGRDRVGVLFVRETSGGAFVETLAVLPEARGKGVATALLAHTLEYLHERGHSSCDLVVDQRNKAAMKIFGRLGFEEASRRTFLVKRPKQRRRKTQS